MPSKNCFHQFQYYFFSLEIKLVKTHYFSSYVSQTPLLVTMIRVTTGPLQIVSFTKLKKCTNNT